MGNVSYENFVTEHKSAKVIRDLQLDRVYEFEPIVVAGGTIVVNRSLVDRAVARDDVQVASVPLNTLAEKIGNARAINMIALGACIKATGIVSLAAATAAMKKMLEKDGKRKFVPLNERALGEGYNAV